MRNTVHNLLFVLTLLAVAFAHAGCEARGRTDRLTPHRFAPEPVEAVEMYFNDREPTYSYRTLAHLEAEATTRRFTTLAEAESAAYEKLRELAARQGATAVIDIRREILIDGQPLAEEPPATAPLRGAGHVVRATGTAVRRR